ncbi:hypothetical protein [Taibaiella soli]|uniref:Uncharacterized protein n=1 Tax=Taibaiella soli TaxID=1649169 RepID=A0A2W2B4S9_9BACT|nr:hypothetical protein [Taibaiella soli]PZF71097.1 hypothetical protein DN068_20580 [Taibaiella soli]
MYPTICYKTGPLEDSYSIFCDNLKIGKLGKETWFGNTITASLNNHQFTFVNKVFFRNRILIFDENANQIATIETGNVFNITPMCTLALSNGTCYRWSAGGILAHEWQWQLTERIMMNSGKPEGLFKRSNTIEINEPSDDQLDLLIVLGIYLQDIKSRRSLTTKVCGIVIVIFNILNWLK